MVQMIVMDQALYRGFSDELQKISKARDVGQLLSSLASRAGVDPSKVPAIKQVHNQIANGNKSRAAEIANNVRGFLKTKAKQSTQATP